MPRIYLSIIIPAYDEASKIGKDITKAEEFLNQNKIIGEVFVSTDKKTDPTNEVVIDLQKKYPNLHLLCDNKRPGKGTAIKKGVDLAKGKYILFADAGYCVPFNFAKDGLELIEQGCDLAIASRAMGHSKIKKSQPFYRRLGSRAFHLLILFLGAPGNIKDTQCGFKLYKTDVAKKLFKDLKTAGNMFDIELILKAKKCNYKIGQFPVEWTNDPATKLNPLTGWYKILKDLYGIKKNQ